MGLDVTERRLWNLTDVILADEDTNSTLTDNANRTIQGIVAMQVTQPGGANFANNENGAIWWPNFEPMQLMQVEPTGGQICK